MLCKATPPKAARFLLESWARIDTWGCKWSPLFCWGPILLLVGMVVGFGLVGIGEGQAFFYAEVFGWDFLLATTLLGTAICVAALVAVVVLGFGLCLAGSACKYELESRAREAGWSG